MMPLRNSLVAAVLATAVLTACGAKGPAVVGPAPASSTLGTSDLTAIAKARADSARYPYTAADITFMSGMISHHAQAIRMAGWAPGHGASSSIQILAERVINAQQDEISLMQAWLRDRLLPVPEPNPMGMKMVMGGEEHLMLMPGMLTEDQMRQLDQARGGEFDRRFLTFMIQHHRGAVTMVNELFSQNGAGQNETVFKLASDVNVDQTTEIVRMERMLAALAAVPRSP